MTHAEAVAIYAAGIRRQPSHYKAHVAADPEAQAELVLGGLDDQERAQFMRAVRGEERKVKANGAEG